MRSFARFILLSTAVLFVSATALAQNSRLSLTAAGSKPLVEPGSCDFNGTLSGVGAGTQPRFDVWECDFDITQGFILGGYFYWPPAMPSSGIVSVVLELRASVASGAACTEVVLGCSESGSNDLTYPVATRRSDTISSSAWTTVTYIIVNVPSSPTEKWCGLRFKRIIGDGTCSDSGGTVGLIRVRGGYVGW
jgi:hypothetical protein